MLKILYGSINADKEPSFLRLKIMDMSICNMILNEVAHIKAEECISKDHVESK